MFCVEQLRRLPTELEHVAYADLMSAAIAMGIVAERRELQLKGRSGDF